MGIYLSPIKVLDSTVGFKLAGLFFIGYSFLGHRSAFSDSSGHNSSDLGASELCYSDVTDLVPCLLGLVLISVVPFCWMWM